MPEVNWITFIRFSLSFSSFGPVPLATQKLYKRGRILVRIIFALSSLVVCSRYSSLYSMRMVISSRLYRASFRGFRALDGALDGFAGALDGALDGFTDMMEMYEWYSASWVQQGKSNT
jgi:hypothetical protein